MKSAPIKSTLMKTEGLQNSTVLLEAFKALLDATPGKFAPGKISVWDYSNPLHFDVLWSAIENGALANAGKVLVVWNRTPLDESLAPVNTAEHVSPLHWAACAAKATLEDQPPLQVAVLDLNPAAHQNEYLHKFVRSLERGRLRWLRLLQAAELFGELSCEGTFQADGAVGDGETLRERLFPQIKASQRNISPDLLHDRIREKLTSPSSPDDRHAIANVVGPMVLHGRDYLASKGFAKHAFLPVFEATGLLPKGLTDGGLSVGKIKAESWGNQPLRLLLVDDQADCGWTDWIRANLPVSNPSIVTLQPDDVITSPDALLDRLMVEWRLMGDAKDRRFTLQLEASGDGKKTSDRQPILLLDLRLHSMRSAESEADFLKRLLPLCERFKSDGKAAPFAWSGFSAQELQIVQRWCEHPKRETPEHLVALSLLPRLIALMDMSLPIVIFSSTGQRTLIEKFKPYGNIITDFEKPRFFGRDARNVITETHAKFEAAIEHAVRLVVARRLSQQMARNVGMADPGLAGSELHNGGQNGEWSAVLYIDESGSARELTLGGILLLLPQGLSESEVDKALRATLEQRSSQGAPPVGPSRNKGWCHGPSNLELLLQRLKERFPTVRICFISLSAGEDRIFDDFAKHDELHDERVADNLWREIFRRLVELAIYAAPSCLVGSGTRLKFFSVRAPTRVLPATSIGRDSWKQQALFNRWGMDVTLVGNDANLWEAVTTIESLPAPTEFRATRWRWLVKLLQQIKPRKQPESMIRYFSFDSPRPVVEEVMRLYRNLDNPPLAEIVRGFLLNCHGRPAAAHIPILHFAVDGFLYRENFKIVKPLVRLSGYYGRNLELLLESNRCMAGRDTVGAIASASAAEFRSGDQIQSLLWKRLGTVLNVIDGSNFLRFSNLASDDMPARDDQAVLWSGKVVKRAGAQPNGKPAYWGVIENQRGKQIFAPSCPADVGDTVTFRPVRDKCPGEMVAADVKKV